MANSMFEYTRTFERPDNLLPNTWIVIRIDGHSFHKHSTKYNFDKPNDRGALDLMNRAAQAVMTEIPDICIGYGHSDEYSFALHPACQLYERRESKLTSTVVSIFTANYVFFWSEVFPEKPLSAPLPSFDARAVIYPSLQNLRDYLSWRQADCHINNLYNTTFWALVLRGGLGRTAAEKKLSGTLSADKHELLFTTFGINYNNEPAIFRKGTVVFHDYFTTSSQPSTNQLQQPNPKDAANANANDASRVELNTDESKIESADPKSFIAKTRQKVRSRIATAHVDIIGKDFWEGHPWVLLTGTERKRAVKELVGGGASSDEAEPG